MIGNKIEILVPCQKVTEPREINKTVASLGMQAVGNFTPTVQPDLLFMRSILVSTGENKNDDVFLPEEMWSARSTPILKPVDWEHNTGRELDEAEQKQNPGKVVVDNQTIGVMYNTYTIDENGAIIDEAIASATDFQIPQKFHIVDEAAIWKGIYPTVAERIERGAAAGNLFVSMEAWFTDYNYLVGNKVVARNEETAFLDRSLRANGGTGSFGNNRVRRVLRNITFGGKGIVARPANEPSIITHVSHEPISAKASDNQAIAKNIICDIQDLRASEPRKEMKMSENASKNTEQQVSLELFTQANKELVDLRADMKNKDGELATASQRANDLQAKLDNIVSAFTKGSALLEEVLPGFASRVTEGNPENFFGVLAERLEEDKTAKAELEAKCKEALAQIAQAEENARAAEREAKIDALLGLAAMPPWLDKKGKDGEDEKKMDEKKKAKKDKMMAAIQGLSDEQFNSLYEVWAEERAEAEEMKRGGLPVEGGSDIGRGAQNGHPHGAAGAEHGKEAEDKMKKDKMKKDSSANELEDAVQQVIARMVNPNGGEDSASLGSLQSFLKELTNNKSEANVVADVAKALAGYQEPTDEENLALILDSVVASEQAPSAGEEAPQGVDLTQSFAGLVGKMLGYDDEEEK